MLTDEELISGVSVERLSACIRRGQKTRQSGGSPEMLPLLILDTEKCRAMSYGDPRPVPARIRLGPGLPFQPLNGASAEPNSSVESDGEQPGSPLTEEGPSPVGVDHVKGLETTLLTQQSITESSVAGNLWANIKPDAAGIGQVPGSWWEKQQQCSKGIAQQSAHTYKVVSRIVKRNASILVVPLAIMVMLIGLGTYGTLVGSQEQVVYRRSLALQTAKDQASSMTALITSALNPLVTMGQLAQQQPSYPDLIQVFDNVTPRLLSRPASSGIYSLVVAPNGIVTNAYPPTVSLGFNLLKDPRRRENFLTTVLSPTVTLFGPVNRSFGADGSWFYALVGTYSVYIQGVDASADFHMNSTPWQCGDWCYINATRSKFWGAMEAILQWDVITRNYSNIFQLCDSGGFNFQLTRVDVTLKPPAEVVIARCDQDISSNPVAFSFSILTESWTLYIEDNRGWTPAWSGGVIACVVVVAIIVALLIFVVLINWSKNVQMLHALLPKKVIWALSQGLDYAEAYPGVTILFTEIVSYKNMASEMEPIQVVHMLNEMYCMYDTLCEDFGLYKVESIGDAFMAAGGCPDFEDPVLAAVRVARYAQALVQSTRLLFSKDGTQLQIQVGLNSGPAVGAVVGFKLPHFSLFGDTVNTASRMESNSSPMCIHISDSTANLLQQANELYAAGFVITSRGVIDVKGKGKMSTWWLGVEPKLPRQSPTLHPLTTTDSKLETSISRVNIQLGVATVSLPISSVSSP